MCLVMLGVLCLLVLLLLLLMYGVWKNVADADLTLLWMEQFGQRPGELFTTADRSHRHYRGFFCH